MYTYSPVTIQYSSLELISKIKFCVMAVDLDEVDIKLLTALQEDADRTNVELARLASSSPAATLHRVRRLKETGVIRVIRAQLDPAAAGVPLQVYVTATLARHDPRSSRVFDDQIRALPQVIEAVNVAVRPTISSPSSPATSPNCRRCRAAWPPAAASGWSPTCNWPRSSPRPGCRWPRPGSRPTAPLAAAAPARIIRPNEAGLSLRPPGLPRWPNPAEGGLRAVPDACWCPAIRRAPAVTAVICGTGRRPRWRPRRGSRPRSGW